MAKRKCCFEGIKDLFEIAVDLDRERLYVTSGSSGSSPVTLKALSLSTGEVVAEAPLGSSYQITLPPDGSSILITGGRPRLFRTEDLAELARVHSGGLPHRTAHFSPSRGQIYVGNQVDAHDLTLLGDLDYIIDRNDAEVFHVQAISPDEQRLFASYQLWSGPPTLYILEASGDLWHATHRIRLRDYGDILKAVVTHDGLKVYVAAYNSSQKDSMSLL